MSEPALTSRYVTTAHCAHLRHKGMYVFADEPPGGSPADAIEPTAFWCMCTQKPFGPDGHPVNARDCVAGRGCCDH
jgi:hypothetical protein